MISSNAYIAGPVVIGSNCDIGPNVCILSATSIGDNVVVSPFSEIKNSASEWSKERFDWGNSPVLLKRMDVTIKLPLGKKWRIYDLPLK